MSKSSQFIQVIEGICDAFGYVTNEQINRVSHALFYEDVPEGEELEAKWCRNRGIATLKSVKNEDKVAVWQSTDERTGYYKIDKTESIHNLKKSINRCDSAIKGCERTKKSIDTRLRQVRIGIDDFGNAKLECYLDELIAENSQ